MTNKLTIPFGINKGKDPGEVSDSWFLLMYSRGLLSGRLKRYAEERIPSLKLKARTTVPPSSRVERLDA